MNEPTEAKEPAPLTGWTKLFHKSGALVTIPVTAAPLDYAAMAANVDAMIAAGFAVIPAGLEEGEKKLVCGWVMRTTQNKNGKTTPIIHLYAPDDTWPTVKTYLNQDEDIEAFEAASGVLLRNIPDWPADSHIQRGTGKDNFIIRVPKPFGLVIRDNPKYDPNETDLAKKKANGPARKFVRWVETPASSPPKDGDCITEKEASLMADIIMKLRTPPMQIGAFIHWLGGAWPKGTPATLDDLTKIPKAQYAKGLDDLQRQERDKDRAGAAR